MSFTKVIRSGLLALVPVLIALSIWILLRADSLVNLSMDMTPGFFVPTSFGEAVRSGYIIWFSIAFIASFICAFIYWIVTQKWRKHPLYYALILIILAVLISLLVLFSGMKFAVEASGEMLIIAIGFGVFLPWICQRGFSPILE